MKRFFKRINPLPLLIAVLLLAAAALLACGPASQAEPQTEPVSQAIAKDGEPEPTLEPTPEPPEYPNLDATLQEIVARFEAEELSESEAAAQAHTYHGSSVLVTVDLSANIDAVDAWMESKDISSRQANPSHPTPNIYGFVKVSLLGALSQQDGVTQVKETVPPWADLPSGQDPGGASGARGASGGTGAEGPSGDAAGPRLPIWLKGHPYHNLDSELTGLVDLYERGELTEAEAAARTDGHRGSSVGVEVELISDSANTDAVIAWLTSKGVSSEYIFKDGDSHAIGAYVPVSMLGALSRQPGIIRISAPRRPNLPSEKDSGSLFGTPSYPTVIPHRQTAPPDSIRKASTMPSITGPTTWTTTRGCPEETNSLTASQSQYVRSMKLMSAQECNFVLNQRWTHKTANRNHINDRTHSRRGGSPRE